MFGIENILSPLSLDEFLGEYKGKKAVLIKNRPEKFEKLYEWEDVNHVINKSRPSYEGVILVYETRTLPPNELVNMSSWLAKGATLVINHIQHIDPVVEQFAEHLADDMNSSVNINGYISFPAKQGFDCHYDTHDVFVVQTCGAKQWKVFEPNRLHPLDRDTELEKQRQKQDKPRVGEGEECYLDCELSPGDVLYIPRGHWHYAVSETPSVHLTCSYSNRSAIDFLAWLVNDLRANNEFFRQDFPVCRSKSLLGDREDDALDRHLDSFRDRLMDIVNQDSLKEHLLAWIQVENPVRKQITLPELAELDQNEITTDMAFRIANFQKFLPRIDEDQDIIQLLGKGKILQLKRVPRELVEFLLRSPETFTGADLQERSPDTAWNNIENMLRQLYIAGLIVRADQSE